MKLYLAVFILLLGEGRAFAQSIPLEVMAGTSNYWYQHSLSRELRPGSRFGFFHVSSLHIMYNRGRVDEIMSQSYITYTLTGSVKIAMGTFYATGPEFSPSVGIQIFKAVKDLFIMINPRLDIKTSPSYDLMAMIEYRPKLTDNLRFYSRFQMMTNHTGRDHNRSYQNLRAGIDLKSFQLGIGINLDEYGKHFKVYYNPGIFIRTEI